MIISFLFPTLNLHFLPMFSGEPLEMVSLKLRTRQRALLIPLVIPLLLSIVLKVQASLRERNVRWFFCIYRKDDVVFCSHSIIIMRQIYNLGIILYFNNTFEIYLPIFNLRILYLYSSIRLTYSFLFSALFDSSGFSVMVGKENYLEVFFFLFALECLNCIWLTYTSIIWKTSPMNSFCFVLGRINTF